MRKYVSKHVEDWQERQVVTMYSKKRMIKDIVEATKLNSKLIAKILEAHGIRRVYRNTLANRKKAEVVKGTIIQQCVEGMSDRHKRLNELFKPTMTA